MNRYHRQVIVEQIGELGQKKLNDAHVAIVGMGGLGAPASLYLAGAGVGKLTLIDQDTVSISNLHRQVLYREKDINQPKIEMAKKALSDLNREIDIVAYCEKLNADNITRLLFGADVIVDATDNFAISYLLSDYALLNTTPLVSASVMKVNGYVGVFCHSTKLESIGKSSVIPSMRAVFPSPPPVGQDCNNVGVIGTVAGIMGLLQAQEVIKVILADAKQLAGRLLNMDLWTYRQYIINFSQASEPQNKVQILSENTLNSTENRDYWTIDVRTREEVIMYPKASHQHIPLSELNVAHLHLDKHLVFFCKSGQRALSAADKAMQAGCRQVSVWL